MLSVFHRLFNDILSKLPRRKQIIPLKKKKEKVKAYIWFPFDSKGFRTFSPPVLVKAPPFWNGNTISVFFIIAGIILQSTQGNTCKQSSEPCVYNLLEFREREGNHFLVIPHTSSVSTHLGRHTEQGARRAAHSQILHETASSFPLHGPRVHSQGLPMLNSLSWGFDLVTKLGKISMFSHPTACR